jgi:hypothetical protein
VDIEDGSEVGQSHPAQRCVARDACVVDQDVYASEALDTARDERIDAGFVSYVACRADCPRADISRSALGPLAVDVRDQHIGAVLVKCSRDCCADALCGSGHDR